MRERTMTEAAVDFAACLSQECWRETIYKKIYLFCAAILIVRNYFKLKFPNDYLWGETMLNYEGGFMRRGLFGQFLYELAPWVDVRLFGYTCFTVAWLACLKLAYDRISSTFDKLTTIILFITPAYFFFYLKDPNAFMRKDQFINMLVFISIAATMKYMDREPARLIAPTAVFTGCFWLAFLIHEASLFYFPLPAWLLGFLWSKRKKIVIFFCLLFTFYVLAGFLTFSYPGNVENARAIWMAWQQFYPALPEHGGALDYLTWTMDDQLASNFPYHHDAVVVRSVIWGLFLAMLPLVWLCAAYRPFSAMWKKLSPLFRCTLPLAALGPWVMPAIACDFGRHIAMGCLEYVMILWAIAAMLRLEPRPWLVNLLAGIQNKAKIRVATLSAVVLYGTSWTLLAWAPVGHSSVILAGLPQLIVYLVS